MFTRKDYMAIRGQEAARAAHRKYYGEVGEAAGVRVPAHIVDWCRKCLRNGDEHFNRIGLPTWDRLAEPYRPAITKALKERGDVWALAMGVCVMKEAARRQIEHDDETLDAALDRLGMYHVPIESSTGKRLVFKKGSDDLVGKLDSQEGWELVRKLDAEKV